VNTPYSRGKLVRKPQHTCYYPPERPLFGGTYIGLVTKPAVTAWRPDRGLSVCDRECLDALRRLGGEATASEWQAEALKLGVPDSTYRRCRLRLIARRIVRLQGKLYRIEGGGW
jgi:hypothetical protein